MKEFNELLDDVLFKFYDVAIKEQEKKDKELKKLLKEVTVIEKKAMTDKKIDEAYTTMTRYYLHMQDDIYLQGARSALQMMLKIGLIDTKTPERKKMLKRKKGECDHIDTLIEDSVDQLLISTHERFAKEYPEHQKHVSECGNLEDEATEMEQKHMYEIRAFFHKKERYFYEQAMKDTVALLRKTDIIK